MTCSFFELRSAHESVIRTTISACLRLLYCSISFAEPIGHKCSYRYMVHFSHILYLYYASECDLFIISWRRRCPCPCWRPNSSLRKRSSHGVSYFRITFDGIVDQPILHPALQLLCSRFITNKRRHFHRYQPARFRFRCLSNALQSCQLL